MLQQESNSYAMNVTFVINNNQAATTRRHQVRELVAQGHASATIGGWLGISEHAARNGVSLIFSRLGVDNRAPQNETGATSI
jgi:DNA-binding NarL/FixJ family response regulator